MKKREIIDELEDLIRRAQRGEPIRYPDRDDPRPGTRRPRRRRDDGHDDGGGGRDRPSRPPGGEGTLGWRNWRWAATPAFPEKPRTILEVQANQDPNAILRAWYEGNPDLEWVGVRFIGRNQHKLRLGGKYGVHRDGAPISVWVAGDQNSEVGGIEIDGYGGTVVNDLVVDDCGVRKAKGAKAPIEDRTKSGRWWFRKLRLYQNVEEYFHYAHETGEDHNYAGAKWGMKPSDGVEQLVVVDSPRAWDPILSIYSMFWEHYGYLTGVRRYYFNNVDLSGGNRTGMQDNTPRAGDWPWVETEIAVVTNCNIEVGFDWDNDQGGAALTAWQTGEGGKLLYAGNTIKTRYAGIALAYQPHSASQYKKYPEPHNFMDEAGFVHKGEHYLLDNDVLCTEGTRSVISINAAVHAHVEGNTLQHDGTGNLVTVDGGFAMNNNAKRCDPNTITVNQDVQVMTAVDGKYVLHPHWVAA